MKIINSLIATIRVLCKIINDQEKEICHLKEQILEINIEHLEELNKVTEVSK